MRKINLYGITKNKEHWYLYSTNSHTTCNEAIKNYISTYEKQSFVEKLSRNKVWLNKPAIKRYYIIYASFK